MSETIRLTWHEVVQSAHGGIARQVSALRDARPLEGGRTDSGFERHIIGVLGETALAKWLGVYYAPTVGSLDTPFGDVARSFHVKATLRSDGELIVRHHDPADFPYVLAIVSLPDVRLVGWLHGHEAKQPGYWLDRNPSLGVHRAAYFVPQRDLRSMSEWPR